MSEIIKIKKGLDIRIKGAAEKVIVKAPVAEYYGVKPTDFHGLIPKLLVDVNQEVKSGSPLFSDKTKPEIVFTSPVNGKVESINRGERRKILEVVVKASEGEIDYERFSKGSPLSMTVEEVKANLLRSGIWPTIRQRPYDIVANPSTEPKAIFISGFDSSPLGPDYDIIVKDYALDFQIGIEALSKLTKEKIYLSLNADYPASTVFTKAAGVDIHYFKGPHPAGNVGVQIHHINPINKGDIVWYINPQDVIIIGRLFNSGIYDPTKIIALTGSEVVNPKYFKLISGASVKSIVEKNVKEGCLRYISGNVLTGIRINPTGHLGYYDSQITVIPEGNQYEFLGWAMPGFEKYSSTRAFFSWLFPRRQYRLHTNLNGSRRAFVMTGQYERVFPMDIYPMQLLKAIMIEDIDLMESLGIYEVAPEDFALCEFIDVSKTEMQQLVRKGLDLMMKEMS